MKPLVLGLNSMHPDSAAVLANEQGIIAAISEERINRKKHSAAYPREAIKEVLRIAGADLKDVTDVAIARDPKANLNAKLMFIARRPVVGLNLAMMRLGAQKQAAQGKAQLTEHMEPGVDLSHARQHNVEHHLSHIASSYYTSGMQRATAVSVDGMGDWCCSMIAKCEGNGIQVLRRSHPPHSLGLFYSMLCIFSGFNRFGEEYKVMGLAAYGKNTYADLMKRMFWYDPEKGLQFNMDYFWLKVESREEGLFDTTDSKGEIVMTRHWTDQLEKDLGAPRKRGEPITQREMDIAASLQIRFEEVYLEMIQDAIRRVGCRDVVLAGGCALNGVANGKAVMQKLVDNIYIHPAAGDDGTAAGAALYVLHNTLGVARTKQMDSAYWGTGWSDDEIEKQLTPMAQKHGLKVTRLSKEQLLKTAVDALCQGKIMGWFQGREEWGPRALGNRSIICNPAWPDMKAILNARIKNRESFRPFAPAILFERLSDVYEGAHEVPFMNIVYKTKPEWREKLSAVNHDDNTGRVQTVKRTQNEMYYDLIKAFDQRTGVPVLLNTSFNENEPIVHTPEQAVACFARTKMDVLGIGSFWCEKPAELAAKAEVIEAEH